MPALTWLPRTEAQPLLPPCPHYSDGQTDAKISTLCRLIPCAVFRQTHQDDKLEVDHWLGDSADAALESLIRSRPPRNCEEILAIAQDEMANNFCSLSVNSMTNMVWEVGDALSASWSFNLTARSGSLTMVASQDTTPTQKCKRPSRQSPLISSLRWRA